MSPLLVRVLAWFGIVYDEPSPRMIAATLGLRGLTIIVTTTTTTTTTEARHE